MNNQITIKGAKEHNLKSIDLTIPKEQLVVFTGVSGSGKSSLAFDTIYAEGQRRYVESLSSYARQFLGLQNKPQVEFIEGLSPSISIDQKTVSHNPRSTVGTITEIYDYMRLLFARIGDPYCVNCGLKISKLSVDEIATKIIEEIEKQLKTDKIKPHKFILLSPVVREKKGEFGGLFDNLKTKGYTNVIIDNKPFTLDNDILLIKTNKHNVEVVIDTMSITYADFKNETYINSLKSRLFNSIEQAVNLSDGLIIFKTEDKETLFSERFTCPNCNLSLPEIEPRMFSFNSPLGACPECKGLGYISRIQQDLILNKNLSISEGGIAPFSKLFFNITWFSRVVQAFLDDVGINAKKPLREIPEDKIQLLLYGNDKTYKVKGFNRFGRETFIWEQFSGIIPELEKRYNDSDGASNMDLERYMDDEPCSVCHGMRLKPEILSIRIKDNNIYELGQLPINKLVGFMNELEHELNQYQLTVSDAINREIKNRLTFLLNVGLDYLTINRTAKTLSGGESQRIRLASQIGSGLTGVIYVLDEPSIGLHSKDVSALVQSLKNLRNLGNSIIVVEHDVETIMNADHIVDFGPFAGQQGGSIVYQGTYDNLLKNGNSLTAKYLSGKEKIFSEYKNEISQVHGNISIIGASQNNLKKISVEFPLGNLICVTGVSGSGKSSLIVNTLYPALRNLVENSHVASIGMYEALEGYQYIDKVYLVDQTAIGKTPRSNPATYIGVFDHIRDVFAQTNDAKARGYKKGRFSFNVKGGRCEKCGGAGTIKIEMQFMPDVYVTCDLCGGKRYNSETLEVHYKDKNIYEVLNFTVDEALEFFKNHPIISHKLQTLQEIGVSYMQLGQPAPTLSGGEAQRIKLANELSKKDTGRTLYVLDEPTTGLHPYDIQKLLDALYKLVKKGNTVVLIEHNLDVINNAQYVIDLGP
jgi:excinuclease ABC subunit A